MEAGRSEWLSRYAKHILLGEVGVEGQEKLTKAKVLVIGAGGLGSSAIYHLAASGVGLIGIVEDDVVELSNLNRQIIHDTAHLGVHKGESARERVKSLNPETEVILHKTFLNHENASEVIKGYDIVIDGSDNLETRFLVNDICYSLKIPMVHGAVLGFKGQISVFTGSEGSPCYRCIYENIPVGIFNFREEGVLGPVPGVIGTLQAIEAIKLIVGIGKPLVGRLLVYDALSCEFRKFLINKNPFCTVCGKNEGSKSITGK